ncbi:SAM-dependent methyltransferase [Corynebacterium ulcerans]|uniref:class I SAM-dependent methyltransferase n=1 Tax=Corynebacterium ulcerans TaxID=65058 RepID=UPI0006284D65|nr:class I SAM-dependent methyltransferase [Corynebacterium ulcerans]KKO84754.1 SAM-dependent methyltransferase [Corynebacterium ulcerans]KKO86780.1 SAM-dependent methyltransferase [Corynebacterium ulcerans]KPJ23383.1 SAM-dependent methyltransferase [Corynebacterium ulcerans]BDV26856.1 SAM-dependent methyltransferase [Corynebacterium ulcerans]
MAKPPQHTAKLANLRRSLTLLRSFRHEQTAPDKFYAPLAADTAHLITSLCRDTHSPIGSVLDVGGGPGYFADEFERRGIHYVSVEPDAGEMSAAGISIANAVRASGTALPFTSDAFDVVYSSNVAEHIADPWRMGEEMLRVTRPGGLTILSYTVWLGPFGGHETGLWQHYIGGNFARDYYSRRHGHPPKNVFGTSLFNVSCAAGLRWARSVSDAQLVLAFPRYHPRWAWWLVRIPILREFLVSNLVVVLKKPELPYN